VLGDVLDFLRLLWALDHALQRRSKQMRATLGVTGPQRFVIRIVGRFPGIPAGKLAEILHVHPSTLTGILERLERRGWIQRRSDPRDRRRSLLGLTAKGRRLDVDLEGTVEAAVRAVLSAIPPRKKQATAEVLRRLAGSLEGAAAERRR
jgi:DNA-binding MarR family transcriptional regulator